MRESADFTSGTTRGRLTSEREGTGARARDFAGQQMDVVAQVIGPHATRMLVETHGPVRDHVNSRIGIKLSQRNQLILLHATHFTGFFHRVLSNEFGVLVETDRCRFAAIRVFR